MDSVALIAELEKTAAELEALAKTPEGVESATDYLEGLVQSLQIK